MRTLLYGAASSLDGYIARADGAVDWLLWSADVAAITAAYWTTIDTVLMGRKTYEVAAAGGGAAFDGKRTVVYSRTLTPGSDGLAEIVAEDAVAHVRALKSAPGAGICLMGGGELARDLFEAGLVDEVGVNVHPILLGGGIPLFRPLTRQIALELVETRAIAHGCVYSRYTVARGGVR